MYPALLNQSPPAPYQQMSPSRPAPLGIGTSPAQAPAPAPNTGGNSPMQPQYNMPQSYAHGGRTKRGKMVMAHMNSKELDVLDHIQGKQERCPRSNMRSYSHLEELLKNPHILHKIHQHVQHHSHGGHAYAHGGEVHGGQASAADGVHGDNELAMIGPHTHQVFDHLARMQGHAAGDLVNPHDGRPQYWSLRDTLGGVWNGIRGGIGSVGDALSSGARTVGNALSLGARTAGEIGQQGFDKGQKFLQDNPGILQAVGSAGNKILPGLEKAGIEAGTQRFGPLGGLAAAGVGSLAGSGLDYLQNYGVKKPTPQEMSPGFIGPQRYLGPTNANNIGSAMGAAAQSGWNQYNMSRPTAEERQPGFIGPQRTGMNQTIGAALSGAGQNYPGSIGGAMHGVGTGISRNATAGRTAELGAQGAWMGSQGQSGVADAARNLMSQYGRPQQQQPNPQMDSSLRSRTAAGIQHGMENPQYGDLYQQ